MVQIRIGNGYDVHPLVSGRDLVLGGVTISHDVGLDGHSDADVLIHAIIDSLLGASDTGDIGKLFPDNDQSFKDISSRILLLRTAQKLAERNITIINIDTVIVCETPKLAPYIDKMKKNLFRALKSCSPQSISIKATTSEKLGFTGRKEGIAAYSVALIQLPS